MRNRSNRVAWLAALLAAASACSAGAPVLTDRDSLLIAKFSNATGDPAFDDALKPAATVLLQQSPFFTIVPDQRVQRVLRAMQRPADDPMLGDLAREVCSRLGARAMLEGSVAATGSRFALNLTVTDCQSGQPLADEAARVSGKEDVVAQLGSAVSRLRRDLGEPPATLQKYDAPATGALTASLEALREFGLGLRARAARNDESSIPFFRQAVQVDPGFALAHAKLAVVAGNAGGLDEARASTVRAWELRAQMTAYERLYIEWNHASRVTQDQAAVRSALEQLTTEYPRDFAARNNFGVYFNGTGEYEEALRQYRAASDLAPDEPGPLSNAAYVLITLGRYDEASEAVDRALAIRPDPSLALARWVAARLAGLPRAGEFEQVARNLASPDQMATVEASLAAWFGRFRTFDRMQNSFIARAKASGNPDAAAAAATSRLMTLAAFRGGADRAALRAAAAREKNQVLLVQQLSALALVGDLATVRSRLARLDPAARDNPALSAALAVPRAYVQAGDGQIDAAVQALQQVLAASPRLRDLNYFIGDLSEQAGDLDAAEAAYRVVTESVTFLGTNPIIPLARVKLARLLIARGDTAGAQAQLDALLAQWQDADSEFMVLSEVKKLRAQIGK